jgi:molybdopterin converting factor small subunit
MIEVHLYGKLRRFAPEKDARGDSVVRVPVTDNDTISDVILRLGIPFSEVGSNIFLNWQYSGLNRRVQQGDRLAIFPEDMQLLYKWYFRKIDAEENIRPCLV